MFRKLCVSFLILCGLCFVPRAARADLSVVTTVPSLAALVKEVGGAHVTVRSLALPTQDPHFVDAKPSLALDLNKADLLVAVGLSLEVGWLPVLQAGARNAKVAQGGAGYVEASRFIQPLDAPQSVDRSQGDIHPGGNPHFLYDPRAAALVTKGLADKMSELDPGQKDSYQANAAAFIVKLDSARKAWEARLSGFRGSPFIGYHKTWSYLADWLSLNQVEALEAKPGVPPNPAHVAEVLILARQRGVKVILEESYYPKDASKLVADKSGARLVIVPGGANVDAGQSYIEHMEAIVKLLEQGFGG